MVQIPCGQKSSAATRFQIIDAKILQTEMENNTVNTQNLKRNFE